MGGVLRWPDKPVVTIAIRLIMMVMAVGCAMGLAALILTLPWHVAHEKDEGWIAYQVAAAMKGGVVYPMPPSFWFNNYPPLSYYVIGGLGKIVGDEIIAGRMIAVAAFIALGSAIAWTARTMGCTRLQSSFSALFFMTIQLEDYVYAGRADPKILGLAFGMAGFALVIKEPRSRGSLFPGSLLLAMAFFTKHDLIFMPAALTIWLTIHDRRNAVRLVLYGASLAVIGAIAFYLAYHVPVWSLLAAPRGYIATDAARQFLGWLESVALPLLASLALFARFPRDRYVVLCALYLAGSIAVGVYFTGGEGVDANVMFDALIALALCCGVGINRFSQMTRGGPLVASLIAGGCLLQLVGILAFRLATNNIGELSWHVPDAQTVATNLQDISFLRNQKGPALCKQNTLCYWAGKPAEVDMFWMGQDVHTGQRDGQDILRAIRNRRYTVIQLSSDEEERSQPFWQFTHETIAAYYRLDHRDLLGSFFVPN